MHRPILIISMIQHALTRHRGPMTVPVRILPKCPITASKNSLFSNWYLTPSYQGQRHGINARVKGCILQIPYSEN